MHQFAAPLYIADRSLFGPLPSGPPHPFSETPLPTYRIEMPRLFGGTMFALLFALGCWALAELAWSFHLPAPTPSKNLSSRPGAVAEKIGPGVIFATRTAPSAPDAVATADAMPALRLLGVLYSTNPAATRAIVQREGDSRPLIVKMGAAIDSGTTVGRVEPKQISLSIQGRESLLRLPERASIAGADKAGKRESEPPTVDLTTRSSDASRVRESGATPNTTTKDL
jgi:type II secretory pathway component PulC